ncbi:MAG: hypothetical protein Q8R10_19475 [Pseudomonas sp.]|uniref:hypothetical protein n=1 Tax=Pseudomonas sp. TaxID=306 RepID=UPI0027332F7E|nr:hypothetical protein [Pseudomonas sp.]MDP3848605.1 hypothetical protein [Pseudomonas sp.]
MPNSGLNSDTAMVELTVDLIHLCTLQTRAIMKLSHSISIDLNVSIETRDSAKEAFELVDNMVTRLNEMTKSKVIELIENPDMEHNHE